MAAQDQAAEGGLVAAPLGPLGGASVEHVLNALPQLAGDDWRMGASEDATLPVEVASVDALAEDAMGCGRGDGRARFAEGEVLVLVAQDLPVAAAILQSGIYDLEQFYVSQACFGRLKANIERETGGASIEALGARSAIHTVQSVRARTLILHGADDGVEEAEALAARLAERGAAHELRVVDGAVLAAVVITIYCYIGLAWALCYVRLGIVRGISAIRYGSAFGCIPTNMLTHSAG